MAASKVSSTTHALFLLINLLFFTMVSSTYVPCPPPPPKHSKPAPSKQPAVPLPRCPRDTLRLGVCADLLGGLVHLVIGSPPKRQCCSLIQDLVDVEAAVCLCTAIKATALGLNIDLSVSLSLLLNYCGKKLPYGFQCPV